MRVNQSNNSNVQSADTSRTRATRAKDSDDSDSSSSSVKSTGDAKTEISSKAKDMAKAKSAAGGAPDVRSEKVAALKARIAAGKYNVDADAVAERMVDEHMQTRSIG